jgi:tetratricopeptide (TPR) repeat protein/cold shock CspA family protein
MNTAVFRAAEEMRKTGRFEEAAGLFAKYWEETRDAATGWRLVYCLRKLPGKRAEALDVAKDVAAMHPTDAWVRSELVWAVYDALCRPAHEAEDLAGTIAAAESMTQAGAGPLPWKLAVFSVIDVAKKKMEWEVVSEWCDRLDRAMLDAGTDRQSGTARKISDLERWYFAKVKALLSLRRWEEAESFARAASGRFPRRGDFSRWAARARAEQGDIAGALDLLSPLCEKVKIEWYFLADYAEYLQRSGETGKAYGNACRAAISFGEVKTKVNLIAQLADYAFALGKRDVASRHLALALAIRRKENWPVTGALERLASRLGVPMPKDFRAETDSALVALLEECRRDWKEGVRDFCETVPGENVVLHRGKISQFLEGRPYAFIREDGGGREIFVRTDDIPKECRAVGAMVEYRIVPSFDAKKGKASVRAVDLRESTKTLQQASECDVANMQPSR